MAEKSRCCDAGTFFVKRKLRRKQYASLLMLEISSMLSVLLIQHLLPLNSIFSRSCWKTFAHSGCGNPCICPVCRQDVGKPPRKRSETSTTRQQSNVDSPTRDLEDDAASSHASSPTDSTPLSPSTGENNTQDSVTISNGGSQVVFMQVERNPWEGIYAFRFPSSYISDDLEQQADAGTQSETSSLLPRNDSNSTSG